MDRYFRLPFVEGLSLSNHYNLEAIGNMPLLSHFDESLDSVLKHSLKAFRFSPSPLTFTTAPTSDNTQA